MPQKSKMVYGIKSTTREGPHELLTLLAIFQSAKMAL